MPMIDIYARQGTFADRHRLATEAAATVMRVEGVPEIPMFRENTAAFVHEMPADAISDVAGGEPYRAASVIQPGPSFPASAAPNAETSVTVRASRHPSAAPSRTEPPRHSCEPAH